MIHYFERNIMVSLTICHYRWRELEYRPAITISGFRRAPIPSISGVVKTMSNKLSRTSTGAPSLNTPCSERSRSDADVVSHQYIQNYDKPRLTDVTILTSLNIRTASLCHPYGLT